MTTAPLKRILFVDDESALLDGLRHVLRSERRHWEMRFASSGREGLEQLEGWPADVVVSDMRMPEMDGVAFLTRVKERWPGAARIVLSGYADLSTVARATALAHQVLLKPCDILVLKRVIGRACELQDVLNGSSLRKIIGELGALPSVPRTYGRLTSALADPDVQVERLAGIVEEDPGIASRVLHFVNSAYYGLAKPVTSVAQAIVYLGLTTLRHLTLTLELFDDFAAPPELRRSFESIEHHCKLTGRVARRLVAGEALGETAFAAGLLHDCGWLVLMNRLPDQYRALWDAARAQHRLPWELEREALGATHAEVGAYLLGLWGLPASIAEAVAYHHHDQAQAAVVDVNAAVYAANLICHVLSPPDELALEGAIPEILSGPRGAAWRAIGEEELARIGRVAA